METSLSPEIAVQLLGNLSHKLYSFQFNAYLLSLSFDDRIAVDRERVNYRKAYLALRNKELSDIYESFVGLEDELKKGIERLNDELNAIQSTIDILNAISGLLGTINKIMALF